MSTSKSKQDLVNENMTELFQLPVSTIAEKSKNIIRPEKVEATESNSKQSEIVKPKRTYKKKAPTRGGARKGAGRPKGSTTKISLEELMTSMEDVIGMPYSQRLATNYMLAVEREDWGLVKEYDKTILPKLVADKVETDITSNGETLGVQLVFNPVELPEWKQQ